MNTSDRQSRTLAPEARLCGKIHIFFYLHQDNCLCSQNQKTKEDESLIRLKYGRPCPTCSIQLHDERVVAIYCFENYQKTEQHIGSAFWPLIYQAIFKI
jgi:deoxycytidylate deaminase